ncbi:MAG: peptidase M23 [Saprospirales bacterium]|nr:MAG: peptidase M23 [Saprospirales bacterium]
MEELNKESRKTPYSFLFGAIALLLIPMSFLLWPVADSEKDEWSSQEEEHTKDEEPNLYFGFIKDSFYVYESEIQRNEFLSNILLAHKVSYATIAELETATRDTYSVRRLRAGRPYAILNRDTTTAADYFIYKPGAFNYVVYSLKDSLYAEVFYHPVDTVVRTGAGYIDHSLWVAMRNGGMSDALIGKMEDALAWTVDFYHIQKGDQFKLIYEERLIDGEAVGVGRLLAANYIDRNGDNYAIYFENENYSGFYDLEGRPMKRAFLRAPVRYTRISSRFNPRRLHPVLQRIRPHLGTDYAAPHGTEIFSVADGVVTAASYTSGNGNYVRIRHDHVYETQYLHMSRFASGIRPGVRVKQGQVIGYVGSTGLATGPHVCFRFWKNGVQVDHLKENLPPPEPMSEEDLPLFFAHRDSILPILDAIPIIRPDVKPAFEVVDRSLQQEILELSR